MDRPSHREIAINELLRWHREGTLSLSPKFQRRRVWPPKAKAFLLDTIIQGMPIPKLYMRQHLNVQSEKTVHEIVDGQQRVGAILDFYKDDIRLPESDESTSGKVFSGLSDEEKRGFLKYEFSVDLLIDASDADVLDIFARINSYSVTLNSQEKRNAKWYGLFKRTVYTLSLDHLEFWKNHKILSDQKVARMHEAELTSELLIGMLVGLQDKKKSIDLYYAKWDDDFPGRLRTMKRFRETIDYLEDEVGDILSKNPFRRSPLFYSLFLAVYAARYGGLGGSPINKPTNIRKGKVRDAIGHLGEILENPAPSAKDYEFIEACQRQTDNIQPRKIRHGALLKAIT
jgi:hypothetical protein